MRGPAGMSRARGLGQDAGEASPRRRVSGEDRGQVRRRQVTREDLAEEIAEVGGEGEIAPVVELAGAEPGPAPVDPAAPDRPPEHEGETRVAVVCAAVAVLAHRA